MSYDRKILSLVSSLLGFYILVCLWYDNDITNTCKIERPTYLSEGVQWGHLWDFWTKFFCWFIHFEGFFWKLAWVTLWKVGGIFLVVKIQNGCYVLSSKVVDRHTFSVFVKAKETIFDSPRMIWSIVLVKSN